MTFKINFLIKNYNITNNYYETYGMNSISELPNSCLLTPIITEKLNGALFFLNQNDNNITSTIITSTFNDEINKIIFYPFNIKNNLNDLNLVKKYYIFELVNNSFKINYINEINSIISLGSNNDQSEIKIESIYIYKSSSGFVPHTELISNNYEKSSQEIFRLKLKDENIDFLGDINIFKNYQYGISPEDIQLETNIKTLFAKMKNNLNLLMGA